MKHITSRDNPFFRNLAKLAQSSRERKKQGLTLIDGVHLIEVYGERFGVPQALVVSESGAQNREVAALIANLSAVAPTVFADALFKDVSPVASPVGILALVPTPKPERLPHDIALCVLCENIQDPGNLGSILRSAAAAGVKHVLLSRTCAFAWSPRVIRASMGAHFLLAIHEGMDLPAFAAGFQGKVVAASVDAQTTLFDTDLTGAVAFLFGNEGAGLSNGLSALATDRVRIPMQDGVESLNAAAAAAVCLFERVRQTR